MTMKNRYSTIGVYFSEVGFQNETNCIHQIMADYSHRKRAIIVFLWLICPDMNMANDCSRKYSREVRKFAEDILFSRLGRNLVNSSCPLSPINDIFEEHEKNKEEIAYSKWKCGYCGKIFRTEHYLDKHMHLKHGDTLQVQQNLSTLTTIMTSL